MGVLNERQIDSVHCRAICDEIGDRLRMMLRPEKAALPVRLQILLDRSFVLLGLLRCGGGRVECFEHFECVLFEIQPRGFRIVDPKQFDNVGLDSPV